MTSLSKVQKDETSLIINKEENFNYNQTISYLSENGYIRVTSIREPGEFSVKGDVMDLFPSDYDNPVRLDSFGDTIEKLQLFNLTDKKSINDLKRVIVYPFNEFVFNQNNEEELGQIFTFFVLEIILLGKLLKINVFDQPAVEQVKIKTQELLSN